MLTENKITQNAQLKPEKEERELKGKKKKNNKH